MPRYNVEYGGKWACFSSICEAFITKFMGKKEYEKWRLIEYGKTGYKPAEECNQQSFGESVWELTLNREQGEAEVNLKDVLGITDEETEIILKKYACINYLNNDGETECKCCGKNCGQHGREIK